VKTLVRARNGGWNGQGGQTGQGEARAGGLRAGLGAAAFLQKRRGPPLCLKGLVSNGLGVGVRLRDPDEAQGAARQRRCPVKYKPPPGVRLRARGEG
jgi:hypothetical protein